MVRWLQIILLQGFSEVSQWVLLYILTCNKNKIKQKNKKIQNSNFVLVSGDDLRRLVFQVKSFYIQLKFVCVWSLKETLLFVTKNARIGNAT